MEEAPARGKAPGPGSPWRRRGGAWAIGLGIALIAWAALHLADASLEGSGRSFETRQSYDEVKRRAHQALLGTLARGAAGLLLVGLGVSLRRAQDGRPGA